MQAAMMSTFSVSAPQEELVSSDIRSHTLLDLQVALKSAKAKLLRQTHNFGKIYVVYTEVRL